MRRPEGRGCGAGGKSAENCAGRGLITWYDGGTGENGHRLADSLLQFYTDWAQVCFQFPRGLWWPSVFNKDGPGVHWSSDEFREPFRLPRGR